MAGKKSEVRLSQGPKKPEDGKATGLLDAERMAEWRKKRLEKGAVGSRKKNDAMGLK